MSKNRKKEVINLVCRQTDYTEKEAEQKLDEYNYNYLEVLKNYMNPNKKKPNNMKSINQEIYKNIRCYLDAGVNDIERQRGYYNKAKKMSHEKSIELNIKIDEIIEDNIEDIKNIDGKNIIDI